MAETTKRHRFTCDKLNVFPRAKTKPVKRMETVSKPRAKEKVSPESKTAPVAKPSYNGEGQCLLIKSHPHRPGYEGFKKQLSNWSEQLKVADERKWLEKTEISKFADWHSQLTLKEADVASKGYARAFADDLDKEFTRFNAEFCKAMAKGGRGAKGTSAQTGSVHKSDW